MTEDLPKEEEETMTENPPKEDKEPKTEKPLKKEEDEIEYSEKYYDETYEYRHVMLPKKMAKKHPMVKLLDEDEWRKIGICQSRGWVHYAIHRPEPHIYLFRRPRQDKNAENSSLNEQQQEGQNDGQEQELNLQT